MMKLKPPNYKFCPFCGKPLQIRIEEGKKRKYCPLDKWTYYPKVTQSGLAVIRKNNQVLLVKRAREPYLGTWMFPSGFVDFGEHPKEGMKREVMEETGLKVKSAKLIQVIQAPDDPNEPGHLLFFYDTQVEDGELKTDEEENSAIAWFDIQKTPKIGWKAHIEIMKKLKKNEVISYDIPT